jgi:hypothetical protein
MLTHHLAGYEVGKIVFIVYRQRFGKNIVTATNTQSTISFAIPFYLQSVLTHSAKCVKNTVACRRVPSSAPL